MSSSARSDRRRALGIVVTTLVVAPGRPEATDANQIVDIIPT